MLYMFNYEKNDQGGLTVTDHTGKDAAAVIPAAVDGLPVTAVGEKAFSWRDGLTSVAIPPSVTEIKESAFAGCTGLESVTIPASRYQFF
jgi:hypothetical protein